MDPKEITLLIQRWEADEARLRKENRKYEYAQVLAEQAILDYHDYEPGNNKTPRSKFKH
jgi:hypothetical protein